MLSESAPTLLSVDCRLVTLIPGLTTLSPLTYYERARRRYYLSLLQFYRTDPAVPADVRATLGQWGLCADEFPGSGDRWPPQLY